MAEPAEEHDPLDDSAQKEAAAKDAEAARLQRAREVDDFKWLMGHRQGRRFMWRLLKMSGLHNNPFHPGAPKGLTEFNCGQMNLGLILQAEIHTICPEHHTTMTREQQEWLRKTQ